MRWAALIALASCAPIPPPDVLRAVDKARAAPAVSQAAEAAPAALAHAAELQAEAHRAFERGDLSGAELLGEQALAAYEAVVAEARAIRAEQQRVKDEAEALEDDKQLAALETEHQRIAADIAALERRVEALRVVEPVPSSGAVQGEREEARREAVRSFQLQARLLCSAARLLAQASASKPGFTVPPDLAAAETELADLDKLAQVSAAAPIDNAQRARASCLAALTGVRRAQDDKSAATGASDALLADLASAGFDAVRDDRGVVVTLRELFDGEKLAAAAGARLDKMAEVAKAHPGAPLMVVVHAAADGAKDAARDSARGAAVSAALAKVLGEGAVGAPQIAGAAGPVVDPRGKHRANNERVEVVFVTPQAL